ncbi:dienelactone hydrolase family protein [Effusibacillus consociatus]|uniref:Dienelactone hydrolase family protein n=1 Tax=Effusibacillus consociatus TaxID=1117041 RepID=A0ABV9Q1C9_9BACL
MEPLEQEFNVHIENVTYESHGVTISSVLCYPKEKGMYPGIITLHGIFGLQEMDVRFPARLAGQGYVVLAHGWQSREKDPADNDIVNDIKTAASFLKRQEMVNGDRLGLIGVCRGGSITMVTGAHSDDFKALVSFYGQSYYPLKDEKKPVSPIELVDDLHAPILLIHGQRDTIFPWEESKDFCEALAKRNKVHECKFYPDAEHGFFLKGHRNYHEESAEDAWDLLGQFLRKNL